MMKRIGTATAVDGRKRQHIEYEISIDTTATRTYSNWTMPTRA